jgi:hypothetical protein
VSRSTQWIAQHGYQLALETDSVIFYKIISKGVRCEIEFQVLQNFVAPVRSMDVVLRRKRLDNFPKQGTGFKPLIMSLRFLMKSQHSQDILPDSKAFWDFIDETSLIQQLAIIQPFLQGYAFDWIENPQSIMP